MLQVFTGNKFTQYSFIWKSLFFQHHIWMIFFTRYRIQYWEVFRTLSMPFHFLFTFNISKRSTVILTFLPVFLLIFCKSWFLDTFTYSSASCIPILTYYSTRKFSLASQTGLIKIDLIICYEGFPVCASGKEPTFPYRRCKRHRFDCCIGKIPWRRQWQPIPVFLPGESHGERILEGCST